MLEKIKELWELVDDKKQFLIEASTILERTPNTMKTHWFAGFWSIPKTERPNVLRLLEEKVLEQKNAENVKETA
tara:strand:- start:1166 stop:1387 length:222 start_codon:yes stop_codon:yes gene_type:complete